MINTNDLILLPLNQVVELLESQGYKTQIINNNYNVVGDTKLVTNVVISSNLARIYYGEFIFNLEGEGEAK